MTRKSVARAPRPTPRHTAPVDHSFSSADPDPSRAETVQTVQTVQNRARGAARVLGGSAALATLRAPKPSKSSKTSKPALTQWWPSLDDLDVLDGFCAEGGRGREGRVLGV